jgi:predicted RNase H-like HicB family nuclease
LKKTYTVIHVDTDEGVEARFPDFPGLTVPGDRLADTIFSAPLVLRRYVEQLIEDRSPVPEPMTPNIWDIHSRCPEALIGFAEVETDFNWQGEFLRTKRSLLSCRTRAAIDQIQLSLGHESIQTTEEYLGLAQDLTDAPYDHLGLRLG